MAKRAFNKRAKNLVVCVTLSSILLGTTISVFPMTTVQAAEKATSSKRNVMYYGDWSIWGGQGNFYPKDIPAEQLTHLNFAFLDFDSNGNLIFTDKDAAVGAPVGETGVQWGGANAGILSAFQELKAKNPNLKIGISIGGWSKSGDFSEVAANPTVRKKFVDNVVKFVEYTNMDFVDLDWEYPGEVRQPDKVDNIQDEGTTKARPEDKENYIKLLQDFRVALDNKGKDIDKTYELSVALPAPKSKLDLGIDINSLFNVVDFANIMTYDMRGAWDETSGHQTGLYSNNLDPNFEQGLSVDQSVNYLISQGAKAEKIVVGAAYYTRGWEKVSKGPDSNLPGLFGDAETVSQDADRTPSRGAANEAPLKDGEGGRRGGVWSYGSLSKLKAAYPGLKEYWDDTVKAPYLYDENSGAFFTYDNIKSVNEKTKYVNDKNLGGMIAWMASQDAISSTGKRDELTKTSKEGLFGTGALPVNDIVYSDLDVDCTIKPVKEAWGTGGGYEITITNKEKLGESDAVLKEVERGAETIKTPKLYVKSDVALKAGDHMAGVVTTENGYTAIDLKGVWEGKTIEPGQSYKFTLTAPEAPTDTSAIKSIELVQRMNEAGTEIARQSIYGDPGTGPEINQAPVLNGVVNKTINKGDKFDKLAGVTATDKEDGDLTNKITVTGDVDVNKAGTYTLIYSVVDSGNKTAIAQRVITVVDEVEPEQNTAPVLNGIIDKVITEGDKFDKLAGVTATDKEDGDLTNKITVTGDIDTNKAGVYTLTYSVKDSGGLETTKTRKITVTAKNIDGDTYDANKVYLSGDTVVYQGKTYKALWWTQGGATPDKNSAWEEVVKPNEDGTVDYSAGKAYNGGAVVKYNGKSYKALWWTNSIPGSDSSWQLI
ncbi:MAG: glycosyl hydrolase family 18 protein [Sarcina sp.]